MKRFALSLAAFVLLTAAADPASESVHVVAKGETLSGIAERANVPSIVIAEANGLREPYAVRTGQKLAIPRQRVHTVKKGDTGFAIALRYGVPFDNIAIANGLAPPYNIRLGQKLIIPAVVQTPVAAQTAPDEPYFRYPHDGTVLLGFTRRADGGGHEGIDFAANIGDMVRAAAGGTIIVAGDEPKRFGRQVVIDHGNGWHSAYGHLARITVSLGELVRSGERIGIAGDAGIATRPELHFELRHDNQPVDPATRLAPRPAGR